MIKVQSQLVKRSRVIGFALAAATLSLNISCSSGPAVTEYPATATAPDEVSKFDRDIQAAHEAGIDQMSPKNYAEAVDKFNDAKSMMGKGKEDTKVLHQLAEARAYLNKANETADRVRKGLPDVVTAREAAVKAKAPEFQKEELYKADDDFRSMTKDYEKGDTDISQSDRSKLQNTYLAIELESIKRSYLNEARNDITKAKKMDAQKWAPRSLDAAEAKFRLAEKTVETDRHNDAAIQPVAKDAILSAQTLLRVTQVAKQTRNDDPERMAMGVVGEQNKLNQTSQQLDASKSALNATETALDQTQAKNSQMAKQRRLDAALESARQKFSSSEADVYRQGDKLLIRLKGLQFPNGRADLRGGSLALLAKVKTVVADLGAQHVVVEGHTDAVGSKASNDALSEKRAEAVSTYLETEKVVSADQVETKGYGFSRPIASNKSATGRAENRRVDVIVTPAGAPTDDSTTPATTPTVTQ